MATKDWKIIDNENNYKVWHKKHEFVTDALVVKIEDTKWVVFMHRGFEGRQGKEDIYSGKSKIIAMKKAKSYMRTH